MKKDFQLQVNGIINMPNLTPTEKLMMIQFITLESLGIKELQTTAACEQIGWSRQGWKKIIRQLVAKGYITQGSRRGWYQLTEVELV